MRSVRLVIAVLIVSPILILAFTDSKFARQPCAQVTAAPGPVTLTAPVAPGQPQAFSTIGALPSLAPAPGTIPLGVASAASTPRAFRCTCSAAGTWTEWAGVVSSSSYFLASQTAQVAVRQLHPEREPAVGVHSARGLDLNQQRPTIYNGEAFTQRAQVATSVGESFLEPRSQEAIQSTQCSQCACN